MKAHQKAKWMIFLESGILILMILTLFWLYNVLVGIFFIVFVASLVIGGLVIVLSIILFFKTKKRD